MRRQSAADLAEVQHGVVPAQEMVCWNAALEIEAIEQAPRLVLPSHHPPLSVAVQEQRNQQISRAASRSFSTVFLQTVRKRGLAATVITSIARKA
jgi:hypothetical protein